MDTLPVSRLSEMAASYNPRKIGAKEMGSLRESLRRFGAVQPVVVNRSTMRIVGGHQRVKAAALEGMAELPVMWVELDEQGERQLNLALNKISGEWDEGLLANVLEEIRGASTQPWLAGFTSREVSDLLDAMERKRRLGDPEATPQPAGRSNVKVGDLIRCGEHLLLCGDATNAEHVKSLVGDRAPNLMVTDPPYGVNYDPNWRNLARRWQSDRVLKVANDDNADWTEAWMLFGGDVAYVWHGALHAPLVEDTLLRAGLQVRTQIIWAKDRFALSRGDYHWQHEPCFYVVRKGKKGHFAGGRSQTTLWEIPTRSTEINTHSTQKPVGCMQRPIENNSEPGAWVYDPFLGSGTTMIACEATGRKCLAMEINPVCVDIAVLRWQNFTGQKAEGWSEPTAEQAG